MGFGSSLCSSNAQTIRVVIIDSRIFPNVILILELNSCVIRSRKIGTLSSSCQTLFGTVFGPGALSGGAFRIALATSSLVMSGKSICAGWERLSISDRSAGSGSAKNASPQDLCLGLSGISRFVGLIRVGIVFAVRAPRFRAHLATRQIP